MKIVAFIPVRGGSKSIPLKNIVNFCGMPLVYWAIKAAHSVPCIDEVVVATEHDKIRNTVKDFNFDKVTLYNRKYENARDTSSTDSVILEYLENTSLNPENTFILIQATSPLLLGQDIIRGLKLFESDSFDTVISCVRSLRNFWNLEGNPIIYSKKCRQLRQRSEALYVQNGAFYISKIKHILKHKNLLSGNIGISEMPKYTEVEIDELVDLVMAEALMRHFIL